MDRYAKFFIAGAAVLLAISLGKWMIMIILMIAGKEADHTGTDALILASMSLTCLVLAGFPSGRK